MSGIPGRRRAPPLFDRTAFSLVIRYAAHARVPGHSLHNTGVFLYELGSDVGRVSVGRQIVLRFISFSCVHSPPPPRRIILDYVPARARREWRWPKRPRDEAILF